MAHFWDDKFWNSCVHEHLHERLTFFLVRTRPFRPKELLPELNKINLQLELGSVRTFQILGPWDLLIRAWLDPHIRPRFIDRLKLLPNYLSHHTFDVEAIEGRWYGDLSRSQGDNRYLLGELYHDRIRAIESGQNMLEYERFKKCGLALERPHVGGITFFISVNFSDQPTADGIASILSQIQEHIRTKLKALERVTVDRGTGFCQVLIKGESKDFFELGSLPSWIGETFHANQVVTETYLSHGRTHIAGDERISVSTLGWMGGFDLFAQSILPELYPKRGEPLREEIERFLVRQKEQPLTEGARKFLHDFLLGVIKSERAAIAQVLFLMYYDAEGFLAEHHKQVLGRAGLNRDQLTTACKVADPDRLSLMDFLQVLTMGMQQKGVVISPRGRRGGRLE